MWGRWLETCFLPEPPCTTVQCVHCTTLGWVILIVYAVVSLSPGCSCNTHCMGVLDTQRKPTPLFSYEGPQCLMRNILPSGGGPGLELNFFCIPVHIHERRGPGKSLDMNVWDGKKLGWRLLLPHLRALPCFWQSAGREDVGSHCHQPSLLTMCSVTANVIS